MDDGFGLSWPSEAEVIFTFLSFMLILSVNSLESVCPLLSIFACTFVSGLIFLKHNVIGGTFLSRSKIKLSRISNSGLYLVIVYISGFLEARITLRFKRKSNF